MTLRDLLNTFPVQTNPERQLVELGKALMEIAICAEKHSGVVPDHIGNALRSAVEALMRVGEQRRTYGTPSAETSLYQGAWGSGTLNAGASIKAKQRYVTFVQPGGYVTQTYHDAVGYREDLVVTQ